MWRSSFLLLKEGLTSGIVRSNTTPFGLRTVFSVESSNGICNCLFSGTSGAGVRRGVNDGARAMLSTTAGFHGGGGAGVCGVGINESDRRSFLTTSGGYGGGNGGESRRGVNESDGRSFSSTVGGDGDGVRRGVDSDGGGGGEVRRNGGENDGDIISVAEAKKLMRLVNVEALKMKFGAEGKEVIYYKELLQACEAMGVAKSVDEAKAFATVLDEAGVVLIFRDKVYLHPDKVVDLVRRAVPLALTADDDPRREELKKLQAKQDEIDKLAHKQVRRILYSGLAFSLANIGLFFRLTFWEFSWDIMEPIAFFATTSGLIVGYAYGFFKELSLNAQYSISLSYFEHGEGLQVLHYEVGQKYEPHFDYFNDDHNTKNGGQRMATVLMYLSDVEEGGETVFPSAKGNISDVPWWNELSDCGKEGLSVKPKMGDALLFWSMKPDATPVPSSLHGQLLIFIQVMYILYSEVPFHVNRKKV